MQPRGPPVTCATSGPDEGDIKRLLLGRVPEAEAVRLEQHFLACPRCSRLAGSLEADDAWVEALRAQAGTSAGPDEAVVARVLGCLESLSAARAGANGTARHGDQHTLAEAQPAGGGG